jgi:hypothetical protein
MNLFINAIGKKEIVIFVTACLILYVQVVVITTKKFGFVKIIGNNMQ